MIVRFAILVLVSFLLGCTGPAHPLTGTPGNDGSTRDYALGDGIVRLDSDGMASSMFEVVLPAERLSQSDGQFTVGLYLGVRGPRGVPAVRAVFEERPDGEIIRRSFAGVLGDDEGFAVSQVLSSVEGPESRLIVVFSPGGPGDWRFAFASWPDGEAAGGPREFILGEGSAHVRRVDLAGPYVGWLQPGAEPFNIEVEEGRDTSRPVVQGRIHAYSAGVNRPGVVWMQANARHGGAGQYELQLDTGQVEATQGLYAEGSSAPRVEVVRVANVSASFRIALQSTIEGEHRVTIAFAVVPLPEDVLRRVQSEGSI